MFNPAGHTDRHRRRDPHNRESSPFYTATGRDIHHVPMDYVVEVWVIQDGLDGY